MLKKPIMPVTGTVGEGNYTVRKGDCMDSIATKHGFFWKTLWELPENKVLRETRKDPNVLLEGDKLTIPELREQLVSCANEAKHTFKRMGVPAKLRLMILKDQFYDDDDSHTGKNIQGEYVEPDFVEDEVDEEPETNAPYRFLVDGEWLEGTTDSDGMIEISIKPTVKRGKLILYPGDDDNERTIMLKLGEIDPPDTIQGAQERLANLGYAIKPVAEEAVFATVLRQFQENHGLEITGTFNASVGEQIRDVHGC